jgi:hypothetical protein
VEEFFFGDRPHASQVVEELSRRTHHKFDEMTWIENVFILVGFSKE